MSSSSLSPLIVKSPIRFAVVGHHGGASEVILASDESYADLIGYHSLREIGLGGLQQLERRGRSESLILESVSLLQEILLFGKSRRDLDAREYSSIDFPAREVSDSVGRPRVYSLIVEMEGLESIKDVLPSIEFEKFRNYLSSIVEIALSDEQIKLRQSGETLAAALSIIRNHLIRKKIRDSRRGQAFVRLSFLYAAAMAFVLVVVGVVTFVEKTMR